MGPERITVCIVGRYNPTELLTGPEKVAKRLFHEFARRDHRTVFIEYFFDGKVHGLFKKLFGFELVRTSTQGSVIRTGILRLNWVLFKLRPDIIHVANFERFAVSALLYCLWSRAKIVYTVHGILRYEETHLRHDFPRFLRFKDFVCEWIFMRYSDTLLFLSQHSVDLARNYYSLPPGRVRIVPNGIDEEFQTTHIQKQISKNHPPTLAFIGDPMRVEKGFDFLMESLAHCPPVQLYLIGVSDSAKLTSIPEHVPFIVTGFLTTHELAKTLRHIDIYVSASTADSFSLASIEAMASGVPSVLTGETGCARYVRNGENGYVVQFGDVKGLAAVLSRLIEGKSLRQRIGNEARKIYSVLAWGRIADELMAIYQSLLVGTGPQSPSRLLNSQ